MKLEYIAARFANKKSSAPYDSVRKNAAVMVLFYEFEACITILMIQRAQHLSNHPGDWAFPGGTVEVTDKTLLDTAIREMEEETAITPGMISYWGQLDPVVTLSGYIVWPFAAMLKVEAVPIPNPDEVADTMYLPLNALYSPEYLRSITFLEDDLTLHKVDSIAYNSRVIWGATARVLFQVALMAKQS